MAIKPQFIKSKMGGSSFTWKYPMPAVPEIAVYTFDATSDVMPTFNAGFTNYKVKDVDNGDGTTTRTIKASSLPTSISFEDKSALLSVEKLDTSNVTNMSNMFLGCTSLTSIDLSNFNTGNVTNMSRMFQDCSSLTSLDLSNFNTSKVTNMAYMFFNCSSLTSLDISNFDTSNVTNMESMFGLCPSLTSLDLSSFDTSKVTTMQGMFYSCSSLTSLDLSNFNTSNVNTMLSMFYSCSSLTSLDLSNFNTSNVNTMLSMFNSCSSLTSLDLSSFNTGNVTNMSRMFQDCSSLTSLDLSNFDTIKVTDMNYMFSGVQKNAEAYYDSIICTLPISGEYFDVTFIDIRNRYTFDLSLTNNLSIALVDENNIGESNRITKWGDGTIDNNLSHTYTTVGTYTVSTNLQLGQESNVQIAQLDFVNTPSLNENEYDDETGRKIKNYGERSNKNYLPSDIALLSDIETFEVSSDTEDSYGNSLSIKDVNTATCLTEAYVGTTSKCAYMFNKCPNLLKVDLTNFKLADDDINMEKMFFRCYALKEIIGIEDLNVSNVENMYDLFAFMGYRYHEYDDDWNVIVSYKFTLDLSKWDISNVKRLDCLVSMCYGLTDLNISTWDTSNVINYAYMFESCYSLTNLQGALNITNKAIYLDGLFSGCRLLPELDVSNWDVSNCTNLSYLFEGCKNLEVIDVSNWVLNEKLEDITSLFEDCNKVKVLDVSNWNIGSTVKYMYGVFCGCNEILELNISNWKPKPIVLGYCFNECYKITSLDVSNFDVTNLKNMAGTFSDLTSLTLLDLSTWNTTKINFVAFCFAGLLLEEIRVPNIKTIQLSNVNSIFCDCINLKVADISGFSCKKITDNTYKYRTFYNVPSDVLVYIDHSKWLLTESELNVESNMFVEKDKNVFTITTTDTENILELTNIYSPAELVPLTNWGDGTTNAELTHTYSTAGNYKVVTNLQFARITDNSNDDYRMIKTPLATRMYAAAPANAYDHLFAKLDRVTLMDVRDFKISIDDADCWCLFYMMSSLKRFIGLENLNTTKIKSFSSLFNGCINVTDLHAVENWDVSNIYNMGYMFKECSSLTSLDLSGWDTSNVTDMSGMFQKCSSLTSLDVSNFNTSNVTNMTNMFNNVSGLSQLHMDYCSSNTVTAVLNVINNRSSKTSGTLYVTDSVYTSVKSLANSKNWYSSPETESGGSND